MLGNQESASSMLEEGQPINKKIATILGFIQNQNRITEFRDVVRDEILLGYLTNKQMTYSDDNFLKILERSHEILEKIIKAISQKKVTNEGKEIIKQAQTHIKTLEKLMEGYKKNLNNHHYYELPIQQKHHREILRYLFFLLKTKENNVV